MCPLPLPPRARARREREREEGEGGEREGGRDALCAYTRTHTTDQTRAPSTQAQLKGQLLRYVSTAMRFSDLGVDARVVACNRVVLLHGARPAEMARDAPRVAKSAEMVQEGSAEVRCPIAARRDFRRPARHRQDIALQGARAQAGGAARRPLPAGARPLS